MDLAAREARYERFIDLLVRLGGPTDSQADRIPSSWTGRRALEEDPSRWTWLEALLDSTAGDYPLETMLGIALEHPRPRVRAGAVKLVRFLRDRRFLPHLVNGLEDTDDLVREMSARALGILGGPQHIPSLAPLMDRYHELEESLQRDMRPLHELHVARSSRDDGAETP